MGKFDGARAVAEMLKLMETPKREKLLEEVARLNPAIAEKIRQKMFVFEDLLKVEGLGLRLVLGALPQKTLLLALRGGSEEVKAAIFKSLSKRAGQILKEELENQGPQRRAMIQDAQREICQIAEKLIGEGKLRLKD